MGTENVDNDILNTNSEENVISDNQDTAESNDEVKVGIFITEEDIEDLDENESSLPAEVIVSDKTGDEAVSGTEVDPSVSNVSTSDNEAINEDPVPDKEGSKDDLVPATDEEASRQEKDHQKKNSVQVEEERN